jgi:hypothetical protein
MVWGVAFWVIVWGLRYRLSRYDPLQAPSHQIPPAEPLESDQQANAFDSASASSAKASARALRTAHTTTFLSFLLAVSLLTSPVSGLKEQKVSSSWHLSVTPSLALCPPSARSRLAVPPKSNQRIRSRDCERSGNLRPGGCI